MRRKIIANTQLYIALTFIILICMSVNSCDSGNNKTVRITEIPVSFSSISDDGRYLLNVTEANAANLWDLSKNQHIYEWHNNKDQEKIAFSSISPDGLYAATAEAHNVAVWDIHTGNTIGYWTIKNNILCSSLGRDGHYAALGLQDGKVFYVNMYTGKSVRTFQHLGPVNSVALSADTRYAISGSDDNTAVLWNIQTGESIYQWPHQDHVTQVAISPHNDYAMSYSKNGTLKIWRIDDGKLLRQFHPDSQFSAFKFSKVDHFLALATDKRELILWDVESGETKQSWNLPKDNRGKILALAFGKKDTLISQDRDGYLYRNKISN